MPPLTRLRRQAPIIRAYFDSHSKKVFTRNEIAEIFREQRPQWNLPYSLKFGAFVQALADAGLLSSADLPSPYGTFKRFFAGTPDLYEVALSLRARSYLSHAAAAALHGLTAGQPQVVHVNREQSPKPRGGQLTQESLDRAFAGQQRESAFVVKFGRTDIVLLNGMFTNQLEVSGVPGPGLRNLPATSLERTLIDLAVRPTYSGGALGVLEAYRRARGRASVEKLVSTLTLMGFVYPYHQAIGLYMSRARFPLNQTDQLKALGLHFDFFLAHGLDTYDYDPDWRIRIPKGF